MSGVDTELPTKSLKTEQESELCRCCHAEGTFKNLYNTYYWLDGEPVVYANLLLEGFHIDLLGVKGNMQQVLCSICFTCAQRLEDAVLFKRQVHRCEDKFHDIYINSMNNDPIFEVKIKQELPDAADANIPGSDSAETKPARPRNAGVGGSEEDLWERDSCNDDDGYTPMIKIVPLKSRKKTLKQKQKPSREKRKKGKQSEVQGGTKHVNIKVEYVPGPGRKVPVMPDPQKGYSHRGVVKKNVDYKQTESGYQCLKCPILLKDTRHIRAHIKTVHLKIAKHSCPICSKAFSSPSAFTKHKFEEHDIDDRFKCNACEHAFNTNVQLKKHINTFHMLGQKIKCADCEYETFSIESLNKHKFKHKTVKDYHCKYCKKAFLRKTTMQLHERIHTGDRRKVCAVCGQAFVQKASLNYHMAKYHPEVPF